MRIIEIDFFNKKGMSKIGNDIDNKSILLNFNVPKSYLNSNFSYYLCFTGNNKIIKENAISDEGKIKFLIPRAVVEQLPRNGYFQLKIAVKNGQSGFIVHSYKYAYIIGQNLSFNIINN